MIICLGDFQLYGEIAWSLLAENPDWRSLNIQNAKRTTALIVAVMNNVDSQFIRALVVFGSYISLADSMGNNAIHYAVRIGDANILNALIRPKECKEIELAKYCNPNSIQYLNEQQSILRAALGNMNSEGKTPLKLALTLSNQGIKQILMEIESELRR